MQASANAIDSKIFAAISAAVQAFILGETPATAPPHECDAERLSEWRRAETPNGGSFASRPRNWTTRD